jgi:hypothetical protein
LATKSSNYKFLNSPLGNVSLEEVQLATTANVKAVLQMG